LFSGEPVVGRVAAADGEKDFLASGLARLDVGTNGWAVREKVSGDAVTRVGLRTARVAEVRAWVTTGALLWEDV